MQSHYYRFDYDHSSFIALPIENPIRLSGILSQEQQIALNDYALSRKECKDIVPSTYRIYHWEAAYVINAVNHRIYLHNDYFKDNELEDKSTEDIREDLTIKVSILSRIKDILIAADHYAAPDVNIPYDEEYITEQNDIRKSDYWNSDIIDDVAVTIKFYALELDEYNGIFYKQDADPLIIEETIISIKNFTFHSDNSLLSYQAMKAINPLNLPLPIYV